MLNQNSFIEVAQSSGIEWSRQKGDEAFSVAWVDYNNDGLSDLWISGHGYSGGGANARYPDGKYPYLYLNNGDGTFTNLFDEDWRRGNGGDTHGTTWVDFDNDGDSDVLVSAGGQEGAGSQANLFFVNNNGNLEEQAAERGLEYSFGRGRTSLWFDYDNDGLLDVLLVQAFRDQDGDGNFDTLEVELDSDGDGIVDTTVTAQTRTAVFKQNADGTFTDTTDLVGLETNGGARYAQLADLTGDGELDLVIQGTYQYPLKVYDLSSGTTFQDVTTNIPTIFSSTLPIGPNNDSGEFNDAARDSVIGDFNNDGHNDIFLTRSFVFPQASSIYQGSDQVISADLLLNSGGEVGFDFQTGGKIAFDLLSYFGTEFSIDQSQVFIGTSGRAVTTAELDAIFSGETSSEFVSGGCPLCGGAHAGHNHSTAAFELDPNDSTVTGLKSDRSATGLYIGFDSATQTWQVRLTATEKLNNLPIRVAVESTETIVSESLTRVGFDSVDPSVNALSDILYLYDETTGQYLDKTAEAGLDTPTLSQSVVSGDFDNDMDLDLYVANGYSSFNQANILYDNQGDGTFVAVELAGGALGSEVGGHFLDFEIGQRLAVSDYDNNGFLDIFAGSTAAKSGLRTYLGTPSQLFQNQGNDNNWLQIDLEGVQSNRDGIGTQVKVTTGDVTQIREQNGGSHIFAQNDTRLHFGLADNDIVDLIEIQWDSGITQVLENVAVNQILNITEPFANTITGTEGIDNLRGTSSTDLILGLAGNDIINGLNNNDSIDGGAGNDLILGSEGTDSLNGGAGDDTIKGGEQGDSIAGGIGDDSLEGNLGDDNIAGDEGNDYIFAGFGNDVINGGAGNDTLNGVAGNDIINGGTGNDTLNGDDGNDSLEGGENDDRLDGGLGNDSLFGDYGNDILRGGEGKDVLSGGAGADSLVGAKGNDYLDGGADDDYLNGNRGGDTLLGNGGNDLIIGEDGADSLVGGAGDDSLKGGSGNDTIVGGEGFDFILEEGDLNYTISDTELIGKGIDSISEIEKIDLALGGKPNLVDASAVTEYDLIIRAGGGQDTVSGGAKNDNIFGGIGNDSLSGGAGKDKFIYLAKNHRGDRITDFTSGEDRIFLSASAFDVVLTTGGAINPEQLTIGTEALDESDRFIYNNGNGNLLLDVDGNGEQNPLLVAKLENTPETITSDDIWIIV
ncbi:MAG: FG-GAP-like repeat-containing protein [Xenococcus sp. (in: cyanobacteria)]